MLGAPADNTFNRIFFEKLTDLRLNAGHIGIALLLLARNLADEFFVTFRLKKTQRQIFKLAFKGTDPQTIGQGA